MDEKKDEEQQANATMDVVKSRTYKKSSGYLYKQPSEIKAAAKKRAQEQPEVAHKMHLAAKQLNWMSSKKNTTQTPPKVKQDPKNVE